MLVELQKSSGKAGGIPKLLRYSMLDHPPAANTDVFLLAQLLRRLAER